jgi:hypothetical protein
MSLAFEKLKNKIEVAKATIAHQTKVIADRDAKIASLNAKPPLSLTDVKDEDYDALTKGLDEVFAVTPVLSDETLPPVSDAPEKSFVKADTTPPLVYDATPISAPTAVDFPGNEHPIKE